jgi:hypothetical protein
VIVTGCSAHLTLGGLDPAILFRPDSQNNSESKLELAVTFTLRSPEDYTKAITEDLDHNLIWNKPTAALKEFQNNLMYKRYIDEVRTVVVRCGLLTTFP